jgi:phage terminase large subunit-like protein
VAKPNWTGYSVATELERFAAFFKMLGYKLEPFQRLIVEEILSPRRETLVLIPRGAGKSTLLAAVALWRLLSDPAAKIVVAAASREQAAILFDFCREMATHPEVAPRVEPTRREIRTARGWVRVIAADGPKQHGHVIDLAIVDELHAHARRDLYDALRTAMLKKPGARMVTISTAGATVDTPLGELRERANTLPHQGREGALTRATGDQFAMLEWRAEDPDDMDEVLAANPASWITREGLEEQKAACHPLAFARYHANIWTGGKAPFIMPEEWDACSGEPDIPEGSRVVIGVDASLTRDSTAVCLCRTDEDGVVHAGWRVWTPQGHRQPVPLEDVEEYIRELAERVDVAAVVYDEHYFARSAQALEDENLLTVVWPYRRMADATSILLELVRERKLRHGGAEVPRQHAIAAEVDERESGLVLSKRRSRERIDCMVALGMAAWYATELPPPRVSVYERRFTEAA